MASGTPRLLLCHEVMGAHCTPLTSSPNTSSSNCIFDQVAGLACNFSFGKALHNLCRQPWLYEDILGSTVYRDGVIFTGSYPHRRKNARCRGRMMAVIWMITPRIARAQRETRSLFIAILGFYHAGGSTATLTAYGSHRRTARCKQYESDSIQ